MGETASLSEPNLDNIPNLKHYYGPESLPPGSVLDKIKFGKSYALDNFILKAAKMAGVDQDHETLTYYGTHKGKIIGSLVGGLQNRTTESLLIADKMIDLQPDLAWTRGGSLRIEKGIAVIDHQNADGSLGSNSYKWAKMEDRTNPTVFLIRWDAIVDAIKQREYYPGSPITNGLGIR